MSTMRRLLERGTYFNVGTKRCGAYYIRGRRLLVEIHYAKIYLFIYLLYLTLVYRIAENNSINKYQQNQIKI